MRVGLLSDVVKLLSSRYLFLPACQVLSRLLVEQRLSLSSLQSTKLAEQQLLGALELLMRNLLTEKDQEKLKPYCLALHLLAKSS